MIKKILIDQKGNKYYWTGLDLHTPLGVIKSKDVQSGLVKSHQGKVFYCYDAQFVDKFAKIQRGGPAIPVPKEVGMIIVRTGINKNSKIVDAGTGCGVLASYLANVSDNVVSYERKKDFYKLAKKNIDFLGVDVKQKLKDIYEGIEEKNLDLVVLDLPEPWNVLGHAYKALKSGGFLVCYLPNVTQVSKVISELDGFVQDGVIEVIEREWKVDGLVVRPRNIGLMHTAFLVFLRRL